MIKIATVQVKEASRVYADYIEKEAFNLSIDPAAVIGSIAGGYAANKHSNNSREKRQNKVMKDRNLENGTYSQMESILQDLKIVFTPINVIYSVNGQVFEIIQAEEMDSYMKRAFLKKDASYFRNLLINKINMELQLAEQAFAKRLLTANGYGGQVKRASYLAKQELLLDKDEDEFNEMIKKASNDLDKLNLQLKPTFDSLRPFIDSSDFLNESKISKVAGIFDVFNNNSDGDVEDIGFRRLTNEVNVGFLPDRVVYTWNGQMVEQLTVLHMNDEGYEAFKKRDKKFFLKFFKEHVEQTRNSLKKVLTNESDSQEKIASPSPTSEHVTDNKSDKDEDIEAQEKEAAPFEDIVEEIVEEEFPIIERETISPFIDDDIHPIAYDQILIDRYGDDWVEYDLEALLKQIEIDFELRDGIEEQPLNKIMLLHTISDVDHTLFLASFTFEKFMRGMNSKSILFEEFQGNLSFEEIMFGLEVAKAYEGDEVYLQFHDTIPPYVSEELMRYGIRFISNQLYDQQNPAEKDFFETVNDFLMRKWKERDSQGVDDIEEIDNQYTMAEQIVEISEEVLEQYADLIDMQDPYASLQSILNEYGLINHVNEEFRVGVGNMVMENVISHLFTGLFLEYKRQEFSYILEKLQEEGVIRGQ